MQAFRRHDTTYTYYRRYSPLTQPGAKKVPDPSTLSDQPELAAMEIDAIIDDAQTSNVPEITGLGRTLR